MAQTYCTRSDVESIVGTAAVAACIDDNEDGVESAEETVHVTNAIERAAVEMNLSLERQYNPLSALASNAWCKWCNAYLTCYYLYARRGNPAPPGVVEMIDDYRQNLVHIRWGRQEVPEQNPSQEHIATVSNFHPELGKIDSPIRVDVNESTGAAPEGNRKRNVAKMPGWF